MTATALDYDQHLGDTCLTCADVDWLLAAGETSQRIAERMGRKREALIRHLRNGTRTHRPRPDLVARFNTATLLDLTDRTPHR